MAIGDKIEKYTFDYLMQEALNRAPEDIDKRQGSIIYDALAPACYVLASYYMDLRNFYRDTYALTALGEDLDARVAEQGITRYMATYAVRKILCLDNNDAPMEIPMGSRFSTISDTNPIIYSVIDNYYDEYGVKVPGTYQVVCEVPGIIGNQYSGAMVNLSIIPGISEAIMSTLITPARDTEDDETLRQRYFDSLGQLAFGGNIADYKKKVGEIAGVGAIQVYPVWNGGGTVKISILDTEYNTCSDEFVDQVQTAVDPEVNSGLGLGTAPIGHTTTVTTPSEVEINIEAQISPQSGYSIEQLQTPIEDAIKDYLLQLRKQWAVASMDHIYTCSIYLARIISVIIEVPGVANVVDLTMNGEEQDITLTETGELQEVPVIGTVIINE